jgi:hypothetical protein
LTLVWSTQAADIDRDGTISLAEFLECFKSADSDASGSGSSAKQARKMANAAPEDLENHAKLLSLLNDVGEVSRDAAKQKEFAKKREGQVKAQA